MECLESCNVYEQRTRERGDEMDSLAHVSADSSTIMLPTLSIYKHGNHTRRDTVGCEPGLTDVVLKDRSANRVTVNRVTANRVTANNVVRSSAQGCIY